MDLYRQVGNDLRALFKDLWNPQLEGAVRQKLHKILREAKQIGGSMEKQAEQLNADILQFLERPSDPKRLAMMKKHALKLEEQTRDL